MNYDDWKTNAPELVDDAPHPLDEPTCLRCGQPLEGGPCADCIRELDEIAACRVVKVCTCCGRQIMRAEWAELPLVGPFVVDESDGLGREEWELRNCGCGSTLMIRVLS